MEVRNNSWGISFSGSALDRPSTEFHEEAERTGQCRLLRYVPTICDPDCLNEICVNAACELQPLPNSVGTLTIEGIPDLTQLSPKGANYFYSKETTPLAVDQQVTIRAPGAIGPSFELSSKVPAAVEEANSWDNAMEDRAQGEDATLMWKSPVPGARYYLRMTTGIGTHGGISPAEVECEGPDTGSLTLPGSYLDELYSAGWSCGECGSNEFIRYRVAETESEGLKIEVRTAVPYSFYFHP